MADGLTHKIGEQSVDSCSDRSLDHATARFVGNDGGVIITSDDDIRDLLLSVHRVAIVGVSPDSARPSNEVAQYLRQHTDWTIWYVNPNATEVLGEHTFRDLADLPGAPDLVDVFRAQDALAEVTDQAIAISADSLWYQLGLTDDEAAAKASENGLTVVQNRCLKVEYARLVAS